MKPASLKLGNTLTLISCRYGSKPLGATDWVWVNNPSHRRLNVPRKIVAVKSKYVELGEERSRLDYPKKHECIEEPGKLTITCITDGNGTCADTGVELIYKVQEA